MTAQDTATVSSSAAHQPEGPVAAATVAGAGSAQPQRILDVKHAVALCVGMVVGAGIFKTSPMVAQALSSPWELYLAWALGGVLSVIGGLCFAELAAAFPDAGAITTFSAVPTATGWAFSLRGRDSPSSTRAPWRSWASSLATTSRRWWTCRPGSGRMPAPGWPPGSSCCSPA